MRGIEETDKTGGKTSLAYEPFVRTAVDVLVLETGAGGSMLETIVDVHVLETGTGGSLLGTVVDVHGTGSGSGRNGFLLSKGDFRNWTLRPLCILRRDCSSVVLKEVDIFNCFDRLPFVLLV